MTEVVIQRTRYDIGAALRKARTRPEYHHEAILLEVARRISDAMEERGVSRADLARKLGVSPAYITKVLRGHENFSLRTLARIAFALGQTWEFLLIDRNANVAAYGRAEGERPVHPARVAERVDHSAYRTDAVKPPRKRADRKQRPFSCPQLIADNAPPLLYHALGSRRS